MKIHLSVNEKKLFAYVLHIFYSYLTIHISIRLRRTLISPVPLDPATPEHPASPKPVGKHDDQHASSSQTGTHHHSTIQWFSGLFNSLIHDNPCLAPIQKMQYLLNYLHGEARDSIGHIPLSNGNYSLSIETLKRRYDNRKRFCDEYAANLLDLPMMEHRSADGLLRIITALNMTLHGLNKQEQLPPPSQKGTWSFAGHIFGKGA